MPSSLEAPTAIDLFCGGGGLTVGLKAAGFNVSASVEIDDTAHATYKANHPEVQAYKEDITTVASADLLKDAGGALDLVAGCPPCQGFTSLTSKYRREDRRNALIDQMARIIEETQPRAVMMENVPGLAQKGKDRLQAFIRRIEKKGYQVTCDVLQVADYGTPQFRRRLVLFAGLGFKIDLPKPTHNRTGADGLRPWRKVKDIIYGLPEPSRFSKKLFPNGATVEAWHVVRNISAANMERLRWAKPGGSWRDIPEEYRVPCHRGDYNGFSNVYGRMDWDAVAPTMTGGCTTLSKGRFGHPIEHRTISVREAALFQEFPETYQLQTSFMDAACDIIGNALPCGFAEAMARQVRAALSEQDAKQVVHA